MTKTVTTGKATDLITFTRSTTGTYLDSVKYGDELVTNGDFSNGGQNWTEEHGATANGTPSASIANGVATLTGFAFPSHASIVQVIQTVAGETYRYSANVTDNNAFLIAVNNVNQAGIITYAAPKSGVITITFVAPSDSTKIILRSQDANGTPSVFDNISVKEVIGNQGTSGKPLLRTANTNEPRIEYDLDGNLKGLLIEEQRTNLVSDSEDMIVPFGRLTLESITSPTNETTAQSWKIAEQASGYWYNYAPINSGTIYTASVFVKLPTEANNAGLRYVRLGSQTTFSTDNAVFDLQTGTQTSASAGLVGSSITPCGNGWYRISITDTATSTTSGGSFSFVLFPASDSSGGSWTQTSDMIGKYLLHTFGWQTEAGLFPTSYIPTSGSTVTRNADVATINLSEFEYNHTESTILVEGEKTARNTSSTGVFTFVAIHDGGSSDRVLLYYNNTILRGQVKSANNVVAQLTSEVAEGGKLGLAYKENDVAFTSNGGTVNTDTSAAMPSGLNTLAIGGYSYSTGQNLNGHIKSLKYYPVRLTDNQLKALTL